LGEILVKKYLCVDDSFNNGFDGGFDLIFNGKRIDVKTMGRTVDVKSYYVNNFVSYQKDFNCDIYIFCSLNKLKNILTICGWVTKNELIERALFYDKGTIRKRSNNSQFTLKAPTYEIENNKLNDFRELFM
jgi:hypothetical protein